MIRTLTTILRDIVINRQAAQPYDQAMRRHNALMEKYNQKLAADRERLIINAFMDLKPEPIKDPLAALRAAIKEGDSLEIKRIALAAYHEGYYPILELAGSYDNDINALVNFELVYGEAANANQKLFLKYTLAAPSKTKAGVTTAQPEGII